MGSEMCIRDRYSTKSSRRAPTPLVCQARESHCQPASCCAARPHRTPVRSCNSYTTASLDDEGIAREAGPPVLLPHIGCTHGPSRRRLHKTSKRREDSRTAATTKLRTARAPAAPDAAHVLPGRRPRRRHARGFSYSCCWILLISCLLYTSPSPRDGLLSRMPSSA